MAVPACSMSQESFRNEAANCSYLHSLHVLSDLREHVPEGEKQGMSLACWMSLVSVNMCVSWNNGVAESPRNPQ